MIAKSRSDGIVDFDFIVPEEIWKAFAAWKTKAAFRVRIASFSSGAITAC